jgi:polyphosphate kinase
VLAARVYREGLANYLDDNTQAWELLSDGRYQKIKSRGKPYSAQTTLLESLSE